MTDTQITITEIVAGGQAANGKDRPTTIHTTGGVKIKCWPNKVGTMKVGKTYIVPLVSSQYQGIETSEIGNGIIKEVMGDHAPASPTQPSGSVSAPAQAQQAQNTPVGVANAASGTRERSIQAQAIIKAVIAVGGTEGDVQRWIDCHDMLVAGKQVG